MATLDYELLHVLASELNMRKAAERMFVSQPALSQRLQSIEKEWGKPLFLRSQKGMTLTPAGEVVVAFARQVLKMEEKTKERLDGLQNDVYGTLKIACATIVGQYWLPPILKLYVERYPNVKISLLTGWSREVTEALYDGDVHIGILRGEPDWKGIRQHLFTDPLYLVDTEIHSFDQIEETERPFIQFKSASNYFQEIQNWWLKKFQIPPKRTIVVDQIETCKQMAFNGIGYAILPKISLQGAGDNIYKLALLNEDFSTVARDTWLIGYESAYQLKQVQAFVDILSESLNESH